MMRENSWQMQVLFIDIIDINELVPENHLLKQIDKLVDFEFIYELAAICFFCFSGFLFWESLRVLKRCVAVLCSPY